MNSIAPLLTSKYQCPSPGSGIVRRERLLLELDHALDVPLTLVSAPPGYGKSVLAMSWAQTRKQPLAWLSLDEHDSGLARFLTYLVAALRHAYPNAFGHSAVLLTANEPLSALRVARALAQDAAALTGPAVVLLDDYHCLATDSIVHDVLRELLRHPPGNLHLVILTRRDPPFSLARLRANATMAELRMEGLRFRRDEAGEFLDMALGRVPDDVILGRIQDTFEGWGAGLRMLALVAARQTGRSLQLRSLPGGLQQIQEYLFDELLSDIPSSLLVPLLLSAWPRRFCAGLVEAMVSVIPSTGPRDSHTGFADLVEGHNLFTTALDSEGRWFRFHSLFRELLLSRLLQRFERDELQSALLAAARWLEEQGMLDDAIGILLDNDQAPVAASIVECHRDEALDRDEWVMLDGWLSLFPVAAIEQSPPLLLTRAALAMFHLDIGLLADIVQRLETFEQSGRLSPGQSMELAHFRALPQFWSGDIAQAREALETLPAAPSTCGQFKGEFEVYLASSRAMTGDPELALAHLDVLETERAGVRDIVSTRIAAARSFVHYFAMDTRATLDSATALVQMTVNDVASEHARGWGHYMQVLAHFNAGHYETAAKQARHALQNSDFVESRVLVDLHLVRAVCAGLAGQAIDVHETALAEIEDQAEAGSGVAELALGARVRAKLMVGDTDNAVTMAMGLPQAPSAGTLAVWLEEPCVTWARALLASGDPSEARRALPLVSELVQQAAAQHLDCQRVDLLLLEAAAYAVQGDTQRAMRLFKDAVSLAAPAGWTRPFTEMAGLARSLAATALDDADQLALIKRALRPLDARALNAGHDPLTNRELDILELLAARRRNKEIARELYISVNTVAFHLKQVYRKLGVNGRREAVVRAESLGLLGNGQAAP